MFWMRFFDDLYMWTLARSASQTPPSSEGKLLLLQLQRCHRHTLPPSEDVPMTCSCGRILWPPMWPKHTHVYIKYMNIVSNMTYIIHMAQHKRKKYMYNYICIYIHTHLLYTRETNIYIYTVCIYLYMCVYIT